MRKMIYTAQWVLCLCTLLTLVQCAEDEKKLDQGEEKPAEPIKDRKVGVWPISGTSESDDLASVYGPRILSGAYDFHRGLDVRVPTGTPVHAILDGTVVRVESASPGSTLERFGKFVVIAHPATKAVTHHQTVYLHLSEISVTQGAEVKAGDQIGKVGKTGVGINTEHLHFEYHVGANDGKQSRINTRNPLRVLPYTHMPYETTATKSDTQLAVVMKEKDKSPDLVRLKVTAGDSYEKIVDFETRQGLNIANEDTNPYQGLYIKPEKFITSSDIYQLTFEMDGSWKSVAKVNLEMKNAMDSTWTVALNLDN